MPYNYLIEEKIRENFEIDYANSVIIIDEAHNISSVCEDTASQTIKESVLDRSVSELKKLQFEVEKSYKLKDAYGAGPSGDDSDGKFESTVGNIVRLMKMTESF
jgi:Rad3-related DNA helicase